MNRLVATVLVILCVSTATSIAWDRQTTPPATNTQSTSNSATQTGQRIGTIISAAVDQAFPVIGKIMDLFKSKKPDEKTTQDQVKKAVETAQTDYKTAAKAKIQPIASIVKEIGVIQAFAAAGVSARANVATINNLLSQATPNYNRVGTEWTIAKNNMADVLALKAEDIRTIREATIQERCLALQNSRKDLMVRIDVNVEDAKKNPSTFSSKQELQDQVAAMADLLKGFNALGAIEFATLQDDIDSLAKWANSPQGSPLDTPLKKPSPKLLQYVTAAETRANKAAGKN